MIGQFKEGVIIGDFDSRSEGLRLVDRSDFPPSQKEMKENIPFVHGEYDFSKILGEVFYSNRTVSYVFYQQYNPYSTRKVNKIYLQNKLLNKFNVRIYDTAKPGYYYRGKVSKIDVTDVHSKNRLEINLELDCYPFMISDLMEGHDIWDEFNFELDVAQPTEFDVRGNTEIILYNVGNTSVVPTIITDSEFRIEMGNLSMTVPHGTSKNELFRLEIGENKLEIYGNGNIKFNYYKELV